MDVVGRRVTAENFIGRRQQLEVLDDVLVSAREGRGDVVLIGGEAGVGKSRLVGELVGRAQRVGALVVTGWCVEHGEQVMPLAPLADVLRGVAASMSTEQLDEVFGRARVVLARLVPGFDPTGVSVGSDLPLPVGRLFDGVLGGLRALSELRPVVVVVEDVHWADESTRQLLTFLAVRLVDHPVVLVVTYRSDDLHRRHPLKPFLVALQRAVRPEHIELTPFSLDELTEMVAAVTHTNPDDGFVARLHDRCGGNAFFAEELLAGGPRSALPPMLRDVVLAHTEGLDDTELTILRAAAAAGPHIDSAVLAVACDVDAAAVSSAVDALVDAGLCARDGDVLRFRHELAREVVQAELLAGQRATVHAALAAALVTLAPQRPGEIARHWMLSGDQPRALEMSVAAGRAAVTLGADAEALLQFERALELWDRVPDAAERAVCDHSALLLEAADAAGRARSFAKATALGRQAIAALAPSDPVAEGLACLQIAEWAWWIEEPDEGEVVAKQLIERAIARIPSEPLTAAWALAVAWHATLLREEGSPMARRRATEALELARACAATRAEARALTTMGILRCREGDPAGLDELRQSLALSLSVGRPLDVGWSYHSLALCSELHGEHTEVLDLEQEALDYCAAAGIYRVYGAMVEVVVIRCLQWLGRWKALEERVDRLRAEFGDLRLEHISLAGSWGLVLVRQGRLDGVSAFVADEVERMHNHRYVLGPAATTTVELAAAEDRISDIPDLVDTTLDRVLPRHQRNAAELVASALGALADRAPHMRARSALHDLAADQQRGASWLARVEQACAQSRALRIVPDPAPFLGLARAELARLHAEPCSQRWAALVEAWDRLGAAYESAYSRRRLAEAMLNETAGRSVDVRSQAQALLTVARRAAVDMGAAPLATEIQSLARRAHINVDTDDADGAPPGSSDRATDASLGLTERELEVLRLVADGYTNGQIGQALYISRKTASVHVSNILRKLGVSSRLQAATVIAKSGLRRP